MISRFSILINNPVSEKLLNPLWDDKLKIVKEREQGEQFFRTKIDGTISFVNEDFDVINNASLDAEFGVTIVEESSTPIASGSFFKTDVEFDYDNRIASVKINSKDAYSAIMDHMEDEIDVLSLGLPAHPLKIDKRAILQLYMLGDTKLTNVVGNQSYEVDAISGAESMTGAQVAVKQFKSILGYYEFTLTPTDRASGQIAEALTGTFKGVYNGQFSSENRFEREDGEYYFAMYSPPGYTGLHALYDKAGNLVIGPDATGRQIFVLDAIDSPSRALTVYDSRTDDLSYLGYAYAEGTAYLYQLYARILTDKETDWIENDNIFTSSDIINYRYVTKPASTIVNILKESYIWSSAKTPDPTKWGVASNGEYFTRPYTPQRGATIPVGWIRWAELSFWVQLNSNRLVQALNSWDSEWTLNDAYSLADVIQKMFNYWNIPVVIQASSSSSRFFWGNSSETSEIRYLLTNHVSQELYVTPVTNIEKTFYDTAARKMTLSLRDIFQMLKGCFNVYWDLKKDDGGNTILRLEHLAFYELGETYDPDQQSIFLDTDSLVHPLVNKPWSFGQSKATYEISDLASRYEFGWPTECTDVFDGFAIQVDNKYVASNQKEEISVPRFFSDVDLVMSTPDAFSDDSVALLGSIDLEKVTRQQLGPLNGIPELPTFFTQNGYLSFLYLELTYHRWSLSGDQIHAEDFPGSDTAQKGTMIAQTVERFRHQTIRIPMSPSVLTSLGNVKTPLGIGIPQKISYELDSCIAEIELLQEN